MNTVTETLTISKIGFFGDDQMSLHLSNKRTVLVPLEKFLPIAQLTSAERKDFEVIDGEYLSFLAIDEVYSMKELIGIE